MLQIQPINRVRENQFSAYGCSRLPSEDSNVQKPMKNLSRHTDLCELVTSLQMGEISQLIWLIGSVKHAIWVDFLSFLYLQLLPVPEILAYFQLHALCRHFGLILIFLEDPL
jgi:hypothetical protein